MKTMTKKLFSLLLVAVLLVSVLPFQALAAATINVDFYDWNGSGYQITKQLINIPAPTMTQGTPTPNTPAGWKFRGWVVYNAGMTWEQVNAAPVESMETLRYGNISFAASYALDTYTVSFNAKLDGVTAPANITVVQGFPFNNQGSSYPSLSGTAENYTFAGWKYGDTILTSANWGTVNFTSGQNVTLEAQWVPNSVRVSFYKWDSETNGYVTHKHVNVPYGSTIDAKEIPALADVDTKPSYEAIGWQTTAGTDAVAAYPANTTITAAQTNFYARYQGDVVTITLDPKDSKLDSVTKEVRIGEKVGSYGGKLPTPSLTGYTFTGWYTPDGQKVDDETIFWNSYSKLEAHWAVQAQVRLLVYKDGDTTNPIVSRLIPGGVVNGQLDVDTIALSQYLPSGATYKLTGYFDKVGWTDYVMNGIINTVDNVSCGTTGVTEVYAMVTTVSSNTNTNTGSGSGSNNTGSGSNTNTTTKPADPTNPATGDTSMIYVSVTVMTLAAAALVVAMQLRKRKMI